MPVNFERELSNIQPDIYEQLAVILQKGNSWMKLAQFLRIFSQSQIATLSHTFHPARSFLDELVTKLCTIQNLKVILKECRLYEAYLIIGEPEPMEVVRQPTDDLEDGKLLVKVGEPFRLQFDVSGIPEPGFQWFKDNELLSDQVTSILSYESFSPSMQGCYTCIAQQTTTVTSEEVIIEAYPLACKLLEKPDTFIYLQENSPVFIQIKATGYPEPQFQWIHDNTVLKNQTGSALFIEEGTEDHGGQYRCVISNKISELVVRIHVIINKHNFLEVLSDPVSDKVALLIGNSCYQNLKKLEAPTNDVIEVALKLQQLGFKTICLQNLNRTETSTAIELLEKATLQGSIVFFYYAGHGFELGERFLLPTDSPHVYGLRKAHAIPESEILARILSKNPALFVLILDMCLKLPNRTENPGIFEEPFYPHEYRSQRNLIKGYSTTSHLSAYEMKDNQNGIYVSTLKKYLTKPLPISNILSKVNAEISLKCPEQMPSISANTVRDFYLNTACAPAGNPFNFDSIDIPDETAIVEGVTINFQKHKKVFNNTLEVVVSNIDGLEYELNSKDVSVTETAEDSRAVLQIHDLQRLNQTGLILDLNFNEISLRISKDFQIATYF